MYDALMTRLNYWLNLDANGKIKILLERREMIMKKKENVENAGKKKGTWKFCFIVSSPPGGKQDRPHLHQFAPIFHSFSYSKRILYLFCRNCYMFLYLSEWSNAVVWHYSCSSHVSLNMARNLHVDRTLVWSRSTIEYCSIDSMVLTEMEYVW